MKRQPSKAERAALRAKHTCIKSMSSTTCRACNNGVPYPHETVPEILERMTPTPVIVPDKEQIRAGNLWNTYIQGWRHGAASKALDEKFTGHTSDEIRQAYNQGYIAGRTSVNKAALEASMHYGYTPSILRLAEPT